MAILRWVGHARGGRRRVENGRIRDAGGRGFGQAIIDLKNHSLGPVVPVLRLVLPPDHRKTVEDVIRIVPFDPIEVEERRIELAAKEESTFLIPAEGRALIAAVFSKRD